MARRMALSVRAPVSRPSTFAVKSGRTTTRPRRRAGTLLVSGKKTRAEE